MVWVCPWEWGPKRQNSCRRDMQADGAFCFSANAVSDYSWIPIPLQISTDAPSLRKTDLKGRSALLADIQQGTRLRKVTQINDRSAPQIEGKWAAQWSLLGAGRQGRGWREHSQTLAELYMWPMHSQTTSDMLKGQATPPGKRVRPSFPKVHRW